MKRGIALNTNPLFSPEQKLRMIEEYVPGKQITLAHIIANPDRSLLGSLSLAAADTGDAVGIVNITPGEAVLIMGDIAVKTSGVKVALVNLSDGSLIITGTVSQTEAALSAMVDYAEQKLKFEGCEITKT